MDKKKVIVYVDGYNFYYGLKNGGSIFNEKYRIVQDQIYISDFDKYIDELEKIEEKTLVENSDES